MSNLQHRQSIIQEKRKKTPRRKFVMEIASRKSLMFYKNQGLVSIYPETDRSPKLTNFKIYDDYIDGLEGKFSGDIFSDIKTFLTKYGISNLAQVNAENSDFSDTNISSKGVYLSNVVINGCENIIYSMSIKDYSTDVIDSMMVRDSSENIYNSKVIIKSFNIFYSNDILGSSNIWFSSNLNACSECIRCNDLQNQSYCIDNKKYEKDQYFKLKESILREKEYFKQPDIIGLNLACDNITGKSNIECQDLDNAYFSYNAKSGKNIFLHGSAKGSELAYDCFTGGSPYASNMYGVMGAGACEHIYCSVFVNGGSSNIFYSINLDSCSFCLGCIGLKNKSYCILNKQYTKEERYSEIDKIFGQMHEDGVLGDFFPATMNPFYFNDTTAYHIDPTFTKEEVTTAGYLRRDEPIKVDIPADAKIVKWNELDRFESWKDDFELGGIKIEQDVRRGIKMSEDSSRSNIIGHLSKSSDILPEGQGGQQWCIDPEILKYVIQDEQGNYYRIIPMEYKFLMKHALPLPRKHRLERMKENFRIS